MSKVILILSVLLLSGCCNISYKKVESVGGCGSTKCAVKFDDGTYGSAYADEAIPGAMVQYCGK